MDSFGADAKMLTLLIIEDNPNDAELLRTSLSMLPGARFKVIEAATLAAAIALLDKEPVHVILLDLSLPDGQGLQTVERIIRSTWRVPIVVMTGLDDEHVAIQAVQAGAQDYLVKGSSDGRTLRRTLRHAIERQRLMSDVEDASELRAQRVTRDRVTGLPSRILLHDRLDLAVARAERFGGIVGFALIDLEGLVSATGSVGRASEERVLIDLVRRMDEVVRKSDTLSRFTESQLGLMIERLESRSVAELVVRRVLGASTPVGATPRTQSALDVFYGLALCPDDGRDHQSLLRSAEADLRRRREAEKARRSGGAWRGS